MVLAHSKQLNHYVHGLISISTFGLWLPVWLVLALKTDTRFLCPECGRLTGKRPPPARTARRSRRAPNDDQD
jgi:hypothetical protein